MYVVAGVTGNTGKVVAETLLAQHLPVRVVVREAKKGEAWKAKGAEVAVANLSDGRAMTAALKGASGAWLLNPPNMAATDIEGNAVEVGKALKSAIAESGVSHVVFLSSVAAQLPSGTGPIVTAHRIEKLFADLPTRVTFLRAGYFMENLLANLHPMKEQGVLPVMFNANKKFEMVATADIGAVGAELLRQGPSAPKVVELAGPSTRSLTDAAAVFGAKLGKALTLAPVPPEAQVGVLTGVGLNPAWAKAYAELNDAMDAERAVFEGQPRRGLISLEGFVERALR